jgi:hypothetical protein
MKATTTAEVISNNADSEEATPPAKKGGHLWERMKRDPFWAREIAEGRAYLACDYLKTPSERLA